MNKLLVAGAVSALFAAAPAFAADGKAVFDQACKVCHEAGIAGAPKAGDKAAWADRVTQPADTLNQHAIAGYTGKTGTMPPKGGFTNLSDDDVKAAVAYMVGLVK